jgi:hypothetical protein
MKARTMKKKVNIEVLVDNDNIITIKTVASTVMINYEECECLISLLYKATFQISDNKRNEA